MRSCHRHRTRINRYRKNKRKMRQRFQQQLFETDRLRELSAGKLPKVVILTGAGISAESGIPTFRAEDGLWENYPVEQVATPEGFARDPEQVQAFYNARRQHLFSATVQPNPAHLALVELERRLGDNLLLVTQNIDNLHERAGSQRVLHMHGELLNVRCENSGQITYRESDVTDDERCCCCSSPSRLRPDIVWFGEMPLHLQQIEECLQRADLFIAIGTSGQVYPAANFVQLARKAGAHTIELNLQASDNNHAFAEHQYGPASITVPSFIRKLMTCLRD